MELPTSLTLEVVTPDRAIIKEQVDEVVLPGSEGSFGVLPGHAPLLATLQVGEMRYRKGQETHYLAIAFGFVEVLPDKVTVLAQVAEKAEEIDLTRAEAAKVSAPSSASPTPPAAMDFERARIAMMKSLVRLQVASRARIARRRESLSAPVRAVMISGGHVLASLRQLLRYRALVVSLVARELKARYRGSVLGFLWTFVNPLLLLLVYSFVFGVVMPGARAPEIEHDPLFLFCGILPWTWFSSSLLESCTALTGSGSLLRKVMFPGGNPAGRHRLHRARELRLRAGDPGGVLDLRRRADPDGGSGLAAADRPGAAGADAGLALLLSALSVHFRDIRDLLGNLLTLWFFATPIIYPYAQAPERFRRLLDLNPFTHLAVAYQDVLFVAGPYREGRASGVAAGWPRSPLIVGYAVFDRLRETFAEEV